MLKTLLILSTSIGIVYLTTNVSYVSSACRCSQIMSEKDCN